MSTTNKIDKSESPLKQLFVRVAGRVKLKKDQQSTTECAVPPLKLTSKATPASVGLTVKAALPEPPKSAVTPSTPEQHRAASKVVVPPLSAPSNTGSTRSLYEDFSSERDPAKKAQIHARISKGHDAGSVSKLQELYTAFGKETDPRKRAQIHAQIDRAEKGPQDNK